MRFRSVGIFQKVRTGKIRCSETLLKQSRTIHNCQCKQGRRKTKPGSMSKDVVFDALSNTFYPLKLYQIL